MSTAMKKLLTAEEFAKLPNPIDGSEEELVRGEVVTRLAESFVHGLTQGQIAFVLESFCRSCSGGRVTIGSGFVTGHEPDTVRGPDVAFWSFDRLPADVVPIGYPEAAADLVVEVRSRVNAGENLTVKVREYFASGVRMVWVVDPEDRTATVYRGPGNGTVLWEDATITGEDVLPGFRCPVAEFFR